MLSLCCRPGESARVEDILGQAKDQCLKYPFPAGTDEKDQKRLQTLKVRQERIQKVVHEEEKDWETGKVSLLHWELWL